MLPSERRRGYGRRIVTEVEQRLASMGCPKINLQVRTNNADAIGFYERIGYRPDDVVSLGKRLIDDSPRADVSPFPSDPAEEDKPEDGGQ